MYCIAHCMYFPPYGGMHVTYGGGEIHEGGKRRVEGVPQLLKSSQTQQTNSNSTSTQGSSPTPTHTHTRACHTPPHKMSCTLSHRRALPSPESPSTSSSLVMSWSGSLFTDASIWLALCLYSAIGCCYGYVMTSPLKGTWMCERDGWGVCMCVSVL